MAPGYPSRHTMERPNEFKPRSLAQRFPLPFKRPGARFFISGMKALQDLIRWYIGRRSHQTADIH